MINNKKVLGIIPARGGSKGIPRKNIIDVGGKPLIAWTIEAAGQSKYIDRLIVSSDDPEIIAIAKQWGCDAPFVRPKELSGDDVSGTAPVLHALEKLPGYDYVVLLQPTSPLRTAEDIDGAVARCVESGANACVSVAPADASPFWMFALGKGRRLLPIFRKKSAARRRQDLPEAYSLNGAVYVALVKWFNRVKEFVTKETIGYVMPRERSLDLDDLFGLEMTRALMKYRQGK